MSSGLAALADAATKQAQFSIFASDSKNGSRQMTKAVNLSKLHKTELIVELLKILDHQEFLERELRIHDEMRVVASENQRDRELHLAEVGNMAARLRADLTKSREALAEQRRKNAALQAELTRVSDENLFLVERLHALASP